MSIWFSLPSDFWITSSSAASYEQSIDAGYLQKIHSGYMTHLGSEMHQGPVMRIDLNDLDFVNRRGDYLKILRQITAHSA